MAKGDTKTNQYLDIAANGTRADLPTDTCCETRSQTLIRGVAERIMDVEDEVEEIKNNPDVVDVVPTYAALQNYDTSSLTDKDIIRVLQDETHDGASTYYRYSTATGTFTYIGESKQYEDFVGTDGTAGGQNGLVPAPVATDAGKFLNANGSWEEVQAGPTVVQTTGTSTTDVMSQDATTSMVFADPSTTQKVQIGNSASAGGNNSVAVGYGASSGGIAATAIGRSANSEGLQSTAVGFDSVARGANSIALGHSATGSAGKDGTVSVGASAGANAGNASYSTQIGYFARATSNGGIALGSYSSASAVGEMNIGSTSTNYGYNSSNYRLLTGLYDPQSAHDAATKGYVDPTADSSAPTTATVGRLGQIQIDTTTATAYMCVAVDTVTPAYTWKQITA